MSKKINSRKFLVIPNEFDVPYKVPIFDLSPEQIKVSARNRWAKYKPDKKISHSEMLDAIVKSLGVSSNFPEYSSSGYSKLLKFCCDQDINLKRLKSLFDYDPDSHPDILAPSCIPWVLAQRIFNSSGRSLPSAFFFDRSAKIANRIACVKADTSVYGPWRWVDADGSQNTLTATELEEVENGYLSGEIDDNDLIEAVLKMRSSLLLRHLDHFVGDVFFQYKNDEDLRFFEFGSYSSSDDQLTDSKRAAAVLHKYLLQHSTKWYRIVPYNGQLVFFIASNGDVDFLFNNMRGEYTKNALLGNALKSDYILKTHSYYHLSKWNYYQNERWIESDLLESRYDLYPVFNQVEMLSNSTLKHLHKTIYAEVAQSDYPWTQIKYEPNLIDGFTQLTLGSEQLAISALITIADFNEFLNENPSYVEHRQKLLSGNEFSFIETLENMNSEIDKTKPVTCNWYDAMAYASWVYRSKNVPVRFMYYREYQSVFGNLDTGVANTSFQITEAINNPGMVSMPAFAQRRVPSHKNYTWLENDGQELKTDIFTYRCDFDSVLMKFNNVEIGVHKGLNFVNSNAFAEWLFEYPGLCVCSGTNLGPFSLKEQVDVFHPMSAGKHKYLKFGFRLCYPMKKIAFPENEDA